MDTIYVDDLSCALYDLLNPIEGIQHNIISHLTHQGRKNVDILIKAIGNDDTSKFLTGVMNQYRTVAFNTTVYPSTHKIIDAIEWSATSEGHEYWKALYKQVGGVI